MAYGTLSRRSGGGKFSNWFGSLRRKKVSRLGRKKSLGGRKRSRKTGKSGRRKKRVSRKTYF